MARSEVGASALGVVKHGKEGGEETDLGWPWLVGALVWPSILSKNESIQR